MLDAMSFLLSNLAQRLRLRRRRARRIITSSPVVRRLPFFSCGGSGGGGGGGGESLSPFVKPKSTPRKLKGAAPSSSKRTVDQHGRDGGGVEDAGEPCVWRRTILLGQRCQPLEFSGAIPYDGDGQRLWQARTPPRTSTPLPSPLHSLGFRYTDRA